MRLLPQLAVFALAVPAIAQGISSIPDGGAQKSQSVNVTAIEFNRLIMGSTYEGDLIVRIDGSGRFLHLVYSPYDFGFESPPADDSQLLPKQLLQDASLIWTFKVHAPLNFREQQACRPAPDELKRDNGEPTITGELSFVAVPGAEGIRPPPIDSLPCMVIDAWSGGERHQPRAAHQEQASR